MLRTPATARNYSQRQSTASAMLPAPTGGVNAVDNVMLMPAIDALLLNNLTPSEFGCRVRKGYIEWAYDENTGLQAVRTILPYLSSGGTAKLFAATADGIYEITSSTTTPTLVVDYSAIAGFVTSGNAGYCSFELFVNNAGSFLLVADEANGYFYYDGSSWTTAPTLSSGITDPKTVSHVKVWKNRVWLTKESTGSAYYLATGAISGANTEFQFGNKFTHGGSLKGLYSFTLDGGDGIDDYLVAISVSGDIVIYQGYDPSSASTFNLKGSWYVGDMPAGSRVAASFGGDLVVLSSYGLLSISKLLSGQNISNPDFYLTKKIARLVRDVMATDRTSRGWEVLVSAKEGVLIINTPKRGNADYTQFVADLNTGGWGVWTGVPVFTMSVWQDNLYFGTQGTGTDAQVYYMSGNIDNILLSGEDSGQVSFSGLTAYQNPSKSGAWKQLVFITPRFIAEFPPAFTAEARYDFDTSEVTSAVGSPPVGTGDVWDTGVWDVAEWEATQELSPSERMVGGSGMGRYVAVAFKGASASSTILVGFDVALREGGIL